jgi:hypothetical protein
VSLIYVSDLYAAKHVSNATFDPPRSEWVLKAILRHAAFSFFSVYVCSRFSSRAETLSNGLFRSDLRKPYTQVNGAAAAILCYVPRYDNQTVCKSLDRPVSLIG